jgi:myosin heavy subunit
MNTPGTFEDNDGLSVTKSEEDMFDELVAAVSAGDSKAVQGVFDSAGGADSDNVPDANDGEDDAQGTDSSNTDDTNEAGSKDDDSTDDADDASTRDTKQDAPSTSVTPEELAALRQELQQLRSSAGRVPALQSQLNQLLREERIKKTAEAAKPVPKVEDPETAELRAQIKELEGVDPTTAAILQKLLDKASPKQEAQQAPDIEELIRKASDDARIEVEFERVVQVHPDAPDIFVHPSWQQWKSKLTPEQRAWAESDKAEQVSEALTAFKNYVNGVQPAPVVQEQQPAPVVDVTQEARQRKLKGSTSTTPSTAIKGSSRPDDETMFNEFYAQALKDMGL